MKKIGITLLTAFVGGAVAVGSYKLIETKYADGASLEEKQKVYFANNPLNITSSAGDVDFVQAAAAVTPAVVHIKTTYSGSSASNQGGDPFEDMFNDFFGGRGRQSVPMMASGSGVIISDDGYIVTNNHVVEDATKIDVILPDKRSFQAKVIGRDPNTDLALIKVNSKNLPVVKLGNSDAVQVGEWVLAVGYPFTLNTTVTAGIVSAKGRSIGILDQPARPSSSQRNEGPRASTAIESFIQTDAAINRGNSGGALVNTKGELIGINAAIASQSGNYEGYGFAIPINLAKKVLEDFKEFGTVKRGFLGVSFPTPASEDQILKEKGITPGSVKGVYITGVQDGSAADAAGLKEGDIIQSIDGNVVSSSAELSERVARHRPGDKIQLGYVREGKQKNISVTLKGEESLKTAKNVKGSSEELYNKLGASFAPLSSAQKQKYKINSGLVVSDVRQGGFFDQFEIPEGTIITSINGKTVNSIDDIDAALGALKDNMIRIMGIAADGARISYNFQIG
ncbi:Do family serine endopeptidase [Rubrolithibacter danxiaensis]|uniref:Do family serine endopeptidase n=1 Tax=Rubrolithibacter danxiaensis TaxID=3390805 RepID=UPI003BF78310